MFHIDKDIHKAKTLPSKFYKEDRFFDLSRENIFNQSWQFICSKSDLLGLTNYPFLHLDGLLNENLLITNNNTELKCISNVCTHRGHIVSDCSENSRFLQCKYHGRKFELNGTFKSMPKFTELKNFPTQDDNLKEIPLSEWNDFLFVALDPQYKISKRLAQIDSLIPKFPYGKLSKAMNKEYLIDCHWSIYCDNYLEGLHIPYVHKGLNADIDYNTYQTNILDGIVMQTAESNNPSRSILYDNKEGVYAYYFFVFPNIMLNYYNWGISVNIIEPITKLKTRIKYRTYLIDGEEIPLNSSSSVEQVESEDQSVVLNVQKGVNSRYYKPGRFSPSMEKGVHYFHRFISENILK